MVISKLIQKSKDTQWSTGSSAIETVSYSAKFKNHGNISLLSAFKGFCVKARCSACARVVVTLMLLKQLIPGRRQHALSKG